jgi:FtsP/CotA-like multicopper oxidase with cupredoxin domain
MRGLIVGIRVAPRRGERPEARTNVRTLRLGIQEAAPRADSSQRFRYVLGAPTTATGWRAGGPVLVLQRGQPTDVVIVNQLKENTAVHWHGIELESWSDGVAGWSGAGAHMAPAIAPADSFTAHLSLPRSGTFIYHTHLGDANQMRGGLYGPIVVLEPGERFDPTFDHLFVAGGGGAPNDARGGFVVNGDRGQSAPLTVAAGTTHRFRFVGMGLNNTTAWELMQDSTTAAMWMPVAKDGADLPTSLRERTAARMLTSVGETRDFLFTPATPGEFLLRAFNGPTGKWSQRIVVR